MNDLSTRRVSSLVGSERSVRKDLTTLQSSLEEVVRCLLEQLGEDPERQGLLETPRRVSEAWREWTAGYQVDPRQILKTFDADHSRDGQIVMVSDIPLYSHCEHHLAPFFGVAHVAYIPTGKIVGLSKLSRLVSAYAQRLQVQERLTNQVAEALATHLRPDGVAVITRCRHMCMESRGVKARGVQTVTSAYRGQFTGDDRLRRDAWAMLTLADPGGAGLGDNV